MDVLPGVDPEIIRTLMDANRAYDVMASYHGVDGIELFMETARILGIDVETSAKIALNSSALANDSLAWSP